MAEYNESQINSNETERISAEQERIENEAKRQTNETEREARETIRQSNESTRITFMADVHNTEDERIANEQVRINAENIRMANEDERLRKEIERQNAEELRQIAYNSSLYARMDEAESQLAHNEKYIKENGVNVKWFGVVGDGVTDDRIALQNAINSGLPLFLPSGCNCVITDYLSAPSNKPFVLYGAGKNVCSIKLLTKSKTLLYSNATETYIHGINFIGTGEGFPEGGENGGLIRLQTKNFTIKDCSFTDADYLAIQININSGNGIISNNTFYNTWAEDIACWASNCIITNNIFKDSQNNAIVTRGSKDIIISNNLFNGVGYDIDATIDIRNSYEENPKCCERIKISNNIFTDCYMPISSSSETDYNHKLIYINDNFFSNPNKNAYDNFIRLQQCEELIFNSNIIKNVDSIRGVYITNSVDLNVSNNIFSILKEGVSINASGVINLNNNSFSDIENNSIEIRNHTTTYSTISSNSNKFKNVGYGISINHSYIGRVQANNNTFLNITNYGIILKYTISVLQTIGNMFCDGTHNTIFAQRLPTTWVKKNNINFEHESGSSSIRPKYPNIGQIYFDTSVNKLIICKDKPILDTEGNITSIATWIDMDGNPI